MIRVNMDENLYGLIKFNKIDLRIKDGVIVNSIVLRLQNALNRICESINLNYSVIAKMQDKGCSLDEMKPLLRRIRFLNKNRIEIYNRYKKEGGKKKVSTWQLPHFPSKRYSNAL